MYASIPFIGEPTDLFKVHESFEFNGHVYHDVFEFANEGQEHYGPVEYELGGEVRCLRQ